MAVAVTKYGFVSTANTQDYYKSQLPSNLGGGGGRTVYESSYGIRDIVKERQRLEAERIKKLKEEQH